MFAVITFTWKSLVILVIWLASKFSYFRFNHQLHSFFFSLLLQNQYYFGTNKSPGRLVFEKTLKDKTFKIQIQLKFSSLHRSLLHHHYWRLHQAHAQWGSSCVRVPTSECEVGREYLSLSACIPNQAWWLHPRSRSNVPCSYCKEGYVSLDGWKIWCLCTSYPRRDHDRGRCLGIVLRWHCGSWFGWFSHVPTEELLQHGPSNARSKRLECS